MAASHRLYEDAQGALTGTLFVALGVSLFAQAGLVPGGVVGLALWMHYAAGIDASLALLLVAIPFYWLAWRRFGAAFTARTVGCVVLLAGMVWAIPRVLSIRDVHPLFAAVAGGLLCGAGMLIVFRHGASFGGFNVVALWLQERRGWRAGLVQLVLDALVVTGGAWSLGNWSRLVPSVLAVVALNLALAINHRPGRYAPA